jgi:DNA-binding MarR family transcriptional regulator
VTETESPGAGRPAAGRPEFGQALLALTRTYMDSTRGVCSAVPGGPKGFHVLLAVAGEPCRNQASIADGLGLDRTVITHTIDELEAAGLVERRLDPRDRRARQIVLTEAGRGQVDAGSAAVREVEGRLLQGLDADEAAAFVGLLHRVALAADEGGQGCLGPGG